MRHVTRVALLIAGLGFVACLPGSASAAHFTFLQAGFTQEIFGVYPGFLGGVAFAADGDVWTDNCAFSGSPMIRFDIQNWVNVNATAIHPQVVGSPFPSNAGCGITNHPDGNIYTNTSGGVVRLSAVNGAQIGAGFGVGGNALGITVDPQTFDIAYVASSGDIYTVDPTFTTNPLLSAVTSGNFIDGMSYDPSGNFIFLANRSPLFRMTVLRRDGTLVQHVPMTSEPDGISFHTLLGFVLTNNLDGTMTRFDFPGNDYTQVPVQSVFASGGFRGDLSNVAKDGCVYLTQDGTRYDNGVVTGENCIVRICGGFSPVSAKKSTWGQLKAIYR